MQADSYSLTQRRLHWLIAVLVIGTLAGGLVIDEFGFNGLKEVFGASGRSMIYMLHKSFGVTILVLMLARLVVRLAHGAPAYATPLPWYQHLASRAVHFLFYAALIAMPIFGWLGTAAAGFPVEFFGANLPGLIGEDKDLAKQFFWLHHETGHLIMFLIAVHILGALYHWKIRRDGVMGRMSLN